MKRIFLALTAIVLLAAACNNDEKADTKDSKEMATEKNEKKFDSTNMNADTQFAVEAADGGMLEVKLGKLAQTQGTLAEVKSLGKMMETDHSKANDELKEAAMNLNIALPATLSDKTQKEYDDLAAKKGKDFDKAYTDMMVDDHQADIKAFQDEADHGNNATLKSWAAGKIPTLQHHLEMSKSAKDAAKGK